MNLRPDNIFHLVVVMILASCSSTEYALKPGGETVAIKTTVGSEWKGELLFFQDSSVYILFEKNKQQKIAQFELRKVTSLEITDFVNTRWRSSIIIFQAIPAVLLVIAASSEKGDYAGGAALIFGLPTLFTYALFEGTTPEAPKSTQIMYDVELKRFRKYSRFPEGLTQEQFQQLLQRYQQTEPLQLLGE